MFIRGANPHRWTPIGSTNAEKFGLELELLHSAGDDVVDTFQMPADLLPDAGYLAAVKYDGSVSGAEFVTQPATVMAHRRNLPRLLAYLRTQGFTGGRDAGLHVHARRHDGNGELFSRKLAALLLVSTGDWDTLQRTVMGRGGGRWAQSIPYTENSRFFNRLENTRSHLGRMGDDKYLRVNFQHQESYEFRQGHSSTRFSRVIVRIEFVAAVLRFLERVSVDRLSSMGNPSAEVVKFREWVQRHGRTAYPHLAEFLLATDAPDNPLE